MTDLDQAAIPYFPAEVEQSERRVKKVWPGTDYYLKATGGRRGCPHPQHRFAQVPDSPARLILPECAGREAWLTARGEGIGGSEVGTLIGVSDYETPFHVYNTKKEGGKDLSHLSAVEWGHRLENVVAEKTAEEIGLVSRFAGGLWARLDNPVLRVTPDRFATRPRAWKAIGVIECKTAGDDDDWESGSITRGGQGTGRAPLPYQAQLQWQLGILGLTKGWLGCYVSNRERSFFTVEVDFDPEWFREMADEAERFWIQNILADEPPMHDHRHPKTEELLKTLHPKVERPSTDLPEGSELWLEDYWRRKLEFERAEKEFTEAKNYFRDMTGDAGAAYLGELKVVSYPEVSASEVDPDRLAKEYPEVAAEVVSPQVDIKRLREEFPEVAKKVIVKRPGHRRLTISVPKDIKARVESEPS